MWEEMVEAFLMKLVPPNSLHNLEPRLHSLDKVIKRLYMMNGIVLE